VLERKDEFELRLMREAGVSIKDCAAYMDISKATVYRTLAKLRAQCGPEKLKGHSGRAHLYRSQNKPSSGSDTSRFERS
jgi:DeoR/GlpR family transcriptional regulator of sugar metabolism